MDLILNEPSQSGMSECCLPGSAIKVCAWIPGLFLLEALVRDCLSEACFDLTIIKMPTVEPVFMVFLRWLIYSV